MSRKDRKDQFPSIEEFSAFRYGLGNAVNKARQTNDRLWRQSELEAQIAYNESWEANHATMRANFEASYGGSEHTPARELMTSDEIRAAGAVVVYIAKSWNATPQS